MLPSTFDDLLGLVGPSLVRKTTNLQKPLPPQLRMAVASRYLATGESQASLSFNYSIGRSTVCQILDEVPEKIWEALSPLSVAQPNTPENWKRLAEDFWNFVFNNSPFGESLNKGCLNIPVHGHLPNTDTNVFFYLRAFPLKDNLLRPYPGRNLEEKLCIFNYRLSRARRVVENAFGILSARWRFLRSPIQAHPEKAIKNVLASVALHNWLKKHEDTQQVYGRFYCPVGYTDYEDSHGILHKGTWRNEVSESGALQNIGKMGTNNYSKAAEYYRSLLADYFLSPQGELPWQYDYIRRTSYDPVS
eukprot:gene5644-10872_t